MANPTAGLFQTLVLPATATLGQITLFKNMMLECIYIQDRAEAYGVAGQTINVNIPTVNEGDVVDIQAGPVEVSDTVHTTVPMVINHNESITRKIEDFNQVRTPVNLRQMYMEPMIESLLRKINRSVCNLVTAANFPSYTTVTGGADVFTRPNVAEAWRNLAGAGVPVNIQDTFLLTSQVPYSNMIGDDANKWITESIVGIRQAESTQMRATIMPQFNATVDWDQMLPLAGAGLYAGLFFHRNAIALIPVAVPAPEDPHTYTTYYRPKGDRGLVFRVQFWYDPREQAYLLHAHCVYALTVVRPTFGSYLQTT